MGDFIRVLPIDGRKVVHPDTFKRIPEEGMRVRRAAYWERMEAQGLVKFEEVLQELKPDEAPKAPKAPEVKK